MHSNVNLKKDAHYVLKSRTSFEHSDLIINALTRGVQVYMFNSNEKIPTDAVLI